MYRYREQARSHRVCIHPDSTLTHPPGDLTLGAVGSIPGIGWSLGGLGISIGGSNGGPALPGPAFGTPLGMTGG